MRAGEPRSSPLMLLAITGASDVPGGIASLNLNILQALAQRAQRGDVQLRVFSYLEESDARPDFLPASVEFRGFGGQKALFAAQLARAAAWQRPLFFFDHVTLALPVLPFAALDWVRTVIFAHGSEAWRHVTPTSRWSFRHADLCLANSRFTLGKMQERLPSFSGEACPLGLSPRFALNKRLPETTEETIRMEAADGRERALGEQVLLLVGRMVQAEQGKGWRTLIRALPELLENYPRAQLVFPGPGNEIGSLKQLARRHGVADHVFLPGFVSHDLLEALYRQCRAYVMPSRQDGFGLVYLEAMNYGKPCVGCFDDGAEDVIAHEETGYLIGDPGDREELLGVLRRLLDDPAHARAMGRRGFERLHDRFTARHFQGRLMSKMERYLPARH